MSHNLTTKELAKLESLIHDTTSPNWRAVCDEVKNEDQIELPLKNKDQLELLIDVADEIISTTDFLEPQGWIS